jgi:hypothetical protein
MRMSLVGLLAVVIVHITLVFADPVDVHIVAHSHWVRERTFFTLRMLGGSNLQLRTMKKASGQLSTTPYTR